jgi:hypothetical protein
LNEPRFKLDATGIFNPRERIPNYDAVAREETESRNDAMLGLAETICGLKVKPLTWRHLLWLDIYQSPFLMDATPELLLTIPDIHLHVARFMWVCSPGWKPFSKVARWIYFRRYRKTLYGRKNNTVEIVRAIHKFVDDSLWDLKADSGGGARRKSYYNGAAAIVHALCEKYGALSPDPLAKNSALDVPVKIIGQLLRVQLRAENPKALMSNRTDALERDWLADLNKNLRKN